jgi:lipopolysaccharide/colanic/teichoic acid biosynthesis glycosyltransferase
MKTGVEYLHSRQKRAVDIALGLLVAPADIGAVIVAKHNFADAEQPYFYQERVGQNADIFIMRKIRTLDENGIILGGLASVFRGKGLDELPQLAAVRDGTMSFFGSRPLIPEEYDAIRVKAGETNRGKELIAKFNDIVVPAKRGLLSRFGLRCHTQGYDQTVEQRLESDIQDHENASLTYDLQTLGMCISAAVKNELLHRGGNTTSL